MSTVCSVDQLSLIVAPTKVDSDYCPVYVSTDDEGHKHFKAYLIGEVREITWYTKLIESLAIMDNGDTMRIIIDSPGGYISAGAQVASLVHHSRGTIYTEARGLAASAAALIHSAAKKECQIVDDRSILMYHMSSGLSYGNTSKIKASVIEQERYVTECLLSKAIEDGHITKDELARICNTDEIFITGEEFKRRTRGEDPKEATTDESASDMMGNESIYGSSLKDNILLNSYGFCLDEQQKHKLAVAGNGDRGCPPPIIIHRNQSDDEDGGHTYHVYNAFSLPNIYDEDMNAVRRLCTFMDNLSENDHITFVLGADEEDGGSSAVGAIIATAAVCPAKVTAVAAGPCSVAETMFWAQAPRRLVARYGMLRFSHDSELCGYRPIIKQYYVNNFKLCLENKILSEEEVDHILKDNALICLHYFDCLKRGIASL